MFCSFALPKCSRDYIILFQSLLCNLLQYPAPISATISITTMFSSLQFQSDLMAKGDSPFHTIWQYPSHSTLQNSALRNSTANIPEKSDLSNTIYLMCFINLAYRWQHDIQLFKTLICVLGIIGGEGMEIN